MTICLRPTDISLEITLTTVHQDGEALKTIATREHRETAAWMEDETAVTLQLGMPQEVERKTTKTREEVFERLKYSKPSSKPQIRRNKSRITIKKEKC